MKTAQASDGKEVIASKEAPKEAICPYCKGIVTLRKRSLMNNGGYVYYWRHRDNKNLSCRGRSRRG
jgi:uncharacterized Zn-finger protein